VLALSVLGALAYVWIRLTTALFYGPLGIVPEQIGTSYPAVLAQAVFGLVALYCIGAILGAAFVGGAWLLSRPLPDGERLVSWITASKSRSVTFLMVAVAYLAASVTIHPPAPVAVLVARGLASAAALVLTLSIARMVLRTTGLAGTIKRVAALASAVAVLGSLMFAHAAADIAREEGGAPPHFFSALFPWQVRTAQVEWNSTPPGGVIGDCVLYLGDAENGAFVLGTDAKGRRRTVLVTPDEGRLSIIPDAYGCSGWPTLRKG
jgi:hypothetical protein